MWSEAELTEGLYASFQGTVGFPGQDVLQWAASAEDNALKRLLGCVIMVAMPEDGVEEAVETLRDIYEFNAKAAFMALPASTKRKRASGKIVAKSERPDLVILR